VKGKRAGKKTTALEKWPTQLKCGQSIQTLRLQIEKGCINVRLHQAHREVRIYLAKTMDSFWLRSGFVALLMVGLGERP